MEDLTNSVLLNNFELKEKKPPGQISDVYRAFDRKRGVDVAVKVLRRDFVNNKDFINYFEHEAELMAELKHPNIVRLYEFIHEKNLVGSVCALFDPQPAFSVWLSRPALLPAALNCR